MVRSQAPPLLSDAAGAHSLVLGRSCGGRFATSRWRRALHRQCYLPHVHLGSEMILFVLGDDAQENRWLGHPGLFRFFGIFQFFGLMIFAWLVGVATKRIRVQLCGYFYVAF